MKTKQISQHKAEAINKHLADLIQFAPPKDLHKSVHTVFFTCLTQKEFVASHNFTKIATDFFFLINFLQNIECNNKTTDNISLALRLQKNNSHTP